MNDVATDPVADRVRGAYLVPLGISAMLDRTVHEGATITGIVCHERLGPPRVWTADEVAFAAAVGDAVARLYDESKLLTVRDALGAYRRQVEELRGSGAIGRLAVGMAHEFGTVLLAAEEHATLITRHPSADPEVSRLARSVLAATERGHRVVESLLRLGHPTQAKPRVVDVSALLRDAEPLLRMAAGNRVTLSIDAGAVLPRVLIDPADLERALIDLAGHARDTMPEGGTLHYRAVAAASDAADDATDVVTIEVRNDGDELDHQAAAQLFEPFASANAGARSGVGLSTVRQALARAGGHVEADRSEHGTTIRLSLPGIGPPPSRSTTPSRGPRGRRRA